MASISRARNCLSRSHQSENQKRKAFFYERLGPYELNTKDGNGRKLYENLKPLKAKELEAGILNAIEKIKEGIAEKLIESARTNTEVSRIIAQIRVYKAIATQNKSRTRSIKQDHVRLGKSKEGSRVRKMSSRKKTNRNRKTNKRRFRK